MMVGKKLLGLLGATVLGVMPLFCSAEEGPGVARGAFGRDGGGAALPISGEARSLMEGGAELEGKRDLEGAIVRYVRAAAAAPESPEVHFRLAEALSKAGRFDAALSNYTLVISISPDHVGALLGRSRLCSRFALHRQAFKDLSRLIELSPGKAEYYYERGRTLLSLHSVREAYRDFLKAHELDGRYPRPTLLENDAFPGPSKVAMGVERFRGRMAATAACG